MKTEEHRILKFIEKNRSFLSVNNIDIAHSTLSGDWFVYNYNKQYHYYEYFIRFSTVTQLVEIISEELRFELHCAIESNIGVPSCEADSIAEQIISLL